MPPSEKDDGPLTPGLVFEMLQAHQRTAALKAAIDLDLFRPIGDGPGDVASVARHCHASERGIRILCDFLVINGVLAKDDGRYRHTATSAAFLDPRSPSCLASIAQFLGNQAMRQPYDHLAEIVRSGRTVLFSTHIMEQAERMCDRIAILARGEKVVDGRITDIKAEGGIRHVYLSFAHDGARAGPVLADRSLVARADDSGATAEVELAIGANPDRLLRALVDAGVGLSRFEVDEPSLQSIFIAKVGQQAATAPAREKAHA